MGGIDMREQAENLKDGTHIVVATPGRLMDMLQKKKYGPRLHNLDPRI